MLLRWRLAWLAVIAMAFVVAASSPAEAQAPGGRGPGGRGLGGFGPGGGGKLALLQDADVRKELEIVPDQEAKLNKIREEFGAKAREAFSGLRDLSDDQRREAFAKMRDKFQEMQKEVEKKVDEVLLPNQQERLRQLTVQSRARRGGAGDALASEEVAKALGITEEQKKRLAEVSQQVQKDVQEKMQKIRAEAEQTILNVLTPEQQAKWKEMVGKPMPPPQRRPRQRGA
jgi:Spy/CpxP family protein refolding chaperone